MTSDISQPDFPCVRGDIAIVGMACTYPESRDAVQFWQNIVNKVDAIKDVSPERWDPAVFYDPDPSKEDRIYCKKGGWMPDAFAFNPLKYGIMPSTVDGAEPDHFLVLRTVYEALQDAGYLEDGVDRHRISIVLGKGNYLGPGVTALMYRGIVTEQALNIIKGLHPEFTSDHLDEIKKSLRARLPAFGAETAAGLIPNISTGRVANRLDFMGRNFTIDAACASSLIATEIGIQDLLIGRADAMLVGGVHIFAHIPFLQVFDAMRALSLSSTIRPFDEECDGTISGEGIGILVLRRLRDAERDGDRIYAVIKGAGSSSDGKAKGVTAPRVEGEELALRRAYETSGVPPETVELIEGHGTATPAGDTAEIAALRNVFGSPLHPGRPTCALGSVKSMIGHAMPAAGAAGLIKAALSLYHRVLPPTLNCRKPRAELVAEDSPFYISSETRPWIHASGTEPRRAGVSAFGFGGVNAHIVLEEYPSRDESSEPTFLRDWDCELIVIGAQDRQALIAALDLVSQYVAQADTVSLRDIAYTLSASGQDSPQKLSIVVSSHQDLLRKLGHAKELLGRPDCVHIRDRQGIYFFPDSCNEGNSAGKVAVLFPGEGSQYVNMLSDLCIHFPQVRKAFDHADAVTNDPRNWPLSAVVFPPPSFSDEQAKAAEARLWTIERATEAVLTADTAMFDLLQQLGLKPDMMVGHSAGEWVAMVASGILNRDEFAASMDRLGAMYRNLAEDSSVPRISMFAVGAGRAKIENLIAGMGAEVHIANDNCPNQVIAVVGREQERAFVEAVRERGFFIEKLPYDRGYHTPAFTYICEPLRQYFSSLEMRSPQLPLYSSTTASPYPAESGEILELVTNTFARPLLFRQTIEAMYEAGARVFVESGPRGNLTAFVDDILRGRPHLSVALDQFKRPGLATLLHGLAMLTAANVPMNLGLLYERRSPRVLTFDANLDAQPGEDRAPGSMLISTCYPKLEPPAPLERVAYENGTHPAAAVNTFAPQNGASKIPASNGTYAADEMPAFVPTGAAHPWVPVNAPVTVSADGHSTITSTHVAPGVLEDHFSLMQEFLDTHEAVMRGFLGQPNPRAAAGAASLRTVIEPAISTGPRLVHTALEQVPNVPAAADPAPRPPQLPTAPAVQSETAQNLTDVLLGIVSERTGYPAEMLGLDLDMEADLGIDSIKRVEILGALRQLGGNSGTGTDADMEQVAKLKTLRQVVELLGGKPAMPAAKLELPSSNERRGLTRSGMIVSHTPGQSVTLQCEISVDEHLYLNDHCLYFAASEFGDQGSPVVSMPLTGSLEIMAEVAALLCPELRVTGAKGMQAVKWINVERDGPPTRITVTANRVGDHVRVSIRRAPSASEASGSKNLDLFAEAVIVFGERYAEPPAVAKPMLKNARPPACTGSDIYSSHRMFHGPRFQGVVALDSVGEDGLIGRLQVLPVHNLLKSDPHPRFHIDPFLLDAAGQLVGYWPVEYLSEGFVALPIRIGEITLFRDMPAPGQEVLSQVRIDNVSHRQLKADFDLIGADGSPWMRISGWEDWRFYWERHIYEFWRFPGTGPNGRRISIPGLTGSDIESWRIDALGETDNTGLWENLWMHMILNRRELHEYEAMSNENKRTEWIFIKASAKDAVRMWLKQYENRSVYPADLEISDQGPGGLQVRSRTPLPAIYVSAAYHNRVSVGAAGGRKLAIIIDAAEDDEWSTREVCARRAAAKLLGLSGERLQSLSVAEKHKEQQRIIVVHRERGDATGAPVTVDTARDGDLIVAVAHQ